MHTHCETNVQKKIRKMCIAAPKGAAFLMAIVRSTVVYEDGSIKEYQSSGKRAFSSFSLVKKQVRRGVCAAPAHRAPRAKTWEGAVRAAQVLRARKIPALFGAAKFKYAFTLTAWGSDIARNGAAMSACAQKWAKSVPFKVACVLEYHERGFHIHGVAEEEVGTELFDAWFALACAWRGCARSDFSGYDAQRRYCAPIEEEDAYLNYVSKDLAETWMAVPSNVRIAFGNFTPRVAAYVRDVVPDEPEEGKPQTRENRGLRGMLVGLVYRINAPVRRRPRPVLCKRIAPRRELARSRGSPRPP